MDTATHPTPSPAAPSIRSRSLAAAWARRHAQTIIAGSLYAVALGGAVAAEFVQDSWLALAGGRDIAHNGLPWHERLTVLTLGDHWVDQQWLGKLFFYSLSAVGGIRLVALAHVMVLVGAVCLAMAVARRRGASDSSVFWVAVAVLPSAPWGWQLRAQSLSYVLFVAVLVILTTERIRPSVRVVACVPLLAVWANVHGSVTLGALLVSCAAVTGLWLEVRQRGLGRKAITGFAALALPGVSLFASPYGLHLAHYYRSLLGNPLMERYVNEWRAPTSRSALVFFVVAAALIWLVARYGHTLTTMERCALFVTGVTGFMTIRGIVWFWLTAILIVPKLLDERTRRTKRESSSALLVAVAAISSGAAMVVIVTQLTHLPRTLDNIYPDSAARVVRGVTANDRNMQVFASERYADWLLWKDPQLAGRIVYDVRFELFNARQFDELADFHARGTRYNPITNRARLLVLDRHSDSVPVRTFTHEAGSKILFENENLVVILRPRPS